MASYVILTPTESAPRDESTVLIRDGFAWLGLLVPVLWLAFHRLWIATALVVVAGLALLVVAERTGWNGTAIAIGVLIAFWIGLEGNGWRVAALVSRGWTVRDVIEAADLMEAEMICFPAGEPEDRTTVPPDRPRAAPIRPAAPPAGGGPALGFIDYEEGR